MTSSASEFDPVLSAVIRLPSRWLASEAQPVRVALRNHGDADLSDVTVRFSWRALGDDAMLQCSAGLLPRHSGRSVEDELQPIRAGRHALHIQVACSVGGCLRRTVISPAFEMEVRHRGDSRSNNLYIDATIHQGDRAGFGSMVMEGGRGVGNDIHVHGMDSSQDPLQWLDGDPRRGTDLESGFRTLEESCLPWISHIGMDLAGIPPGRFLMGASQHDPDAVKEDEVPHEVSLTRSFWMGRTPVTQAIYEKVTGIALRVRLAECLGAEKPAVYVTWDEAADFCRRLTATERRAGGLPPGYAYRLPTEAEWEYVCRAGSPEARYGPLEEIASCRANRAGLCETRRFKPNAWGLHDMLGLVHEWCLDAAAPYRLMESANPLNAEAPPGSPLKRILRGGCYQGPDSDCRTSARIQGDPDRPSGRIGFRVVLARKD